MGSQFKICSKKLTNFRICHKALMENTMKILSGSFIAIICIAHLAIIPGCKGKTAENEADSHQESGHDDHQPPSVTVNPEAMMSAGIKTMPVLKKPFSVRITAPGELEFNARRLLNLTARTPGRIERVLAVSGDRVGLGQLLTEIYSPDYLSKQAEFLQAVDRAEHFGDDQDESATVRAFMESARERLLLLGVSAAEVAELQRTRMPRPYLSVRATFAGTVIGSTVIPGDHVELGSSLFRLADPTILWAGVHIQEKDLAAVRVGSTVEIRTQAYPKESFQGRLLQLGDSIDPGTRTVIGRVEVPNPASKLKAGMYIEASISSGKERSALVVPESALQDDAGQAILFVQTGAGRFARRAVKAGERFSGQVEILDGLAEGENVVTSGAFLLNSELNKGSLEDEHGHS